MIGRTKETIGADSFLSEYYGWWWKWWIAGMVVVGRRSAKSAKSASWQLVMSCLGF